jgi:hypothetical protein
MLVNKSSKKLHEDIKINSNNSTIKGEIYLLNHVSGGKLTAGRMMPSWTINSPAGVSTQ